MHVHHPEQQRVSQTADPEQRQRNGWVDIRHCAEHWGVESAVMPVSWYNAFSTINIVFYRPELELSARDKASSACPDRYVRVSNDLTCDDCFVRNCASSIQFGFSISVVLRFLIRYV